MQQLTFFASKPLRVLLDGCVMRQAGSSLEIEILREFPAVPGLFRRSRLRELRKLAAAFDFEEICFLGKSFGIVEFDLAELPPTPPNRT